MHACTLSKWHNKWVVCILSRHWQKTTTQEDTTEQKNYLHKTKHLTQRREISQSCMSISCPMTWRISDPLQTYSKIGSTFLPPAAALWSHRQWTNTNTFTFRSAVYRLSVSTLSSVFSGMWYVLDPGPSTIKKCHRVEDLSRDDFL